MAGGYDTSPVDPLDLLREKLAELRDKVRELERPTGTQLSQTVARLQDLIDGILAQTNVTVTGDVSAGGTVTGDDGISSVGVYTTDVTALPGGRSSVWVHVSGVLGQTVSTVAKKTNASTDLPFTVEDVLSIVPYVFEYKAQIDIRDNPENPYYDPDYVVPIEIGMMAEHLADAGLELFVEYKEDGVTPAGINYTLFGAVAALVIGRAQAARLDDLETRVQALESTV